MKKTSFLFLSISLVVFYLFVNAACLPILNAIRSDFSICEESVQKIIFLYTLGIGLSQPFYGIIADRYGIKNAIVLGMIIFLIVSVIIFFAENFNLFLFCRFLQGCGAGCCSVVSKMLLSTVYKDEKYVSATALIMIFSVFTEIGSPFISGIITLFFHWKFIFCIMIFFNIFILFTSILKIHTSGPFLKRTLRKKMHLLKNNIFLSHIMIASILLFCITIFNTQSSFLIQERLHLSNVAFSIIFIIVDIPFALSCYFLYKNSPETIIKYGIVSLFIGSFLMMGSSFFKIPFNIFGIILAMAIFNAGTGCLFSFSTARAFLIHKERIGFAGALVGAIPMSFSALLALMNNILIPIDHLNLSIVFFISSFIVSTILTRLKEINI
ncbi:MAG: Multidrug resistance protein MdtL [Holosporales bacterium]